MASCRCSREFEAMMEPQTSGLASALSTAGSCSDHAHSLGLLTVVTILFEHGSHGGLSMMSVEGSGLGEPGSAAQAKPCCTVGQVHCEEHLVSRGVGLWMTRQDDAPHLTP
jgi:hypothetical protein